MMPLSYDFHMKVLYLSHMIHINSYFHMILICESYVAKLPVYIQVTNISTNKIQKRVRERVRIVHVIAHMAYMTCTAML